jgi:hypothetical protein
MLDEFETIPKDTEESEEVVKSTFDLPLDGTELILLLTALLIGLAINTAKLVLEGGGICLDGVRTSGVSSVNG